MFTAIKWIKAKLIQEKLQITKCYILQFILLSRNDYHDFVSTGFLFSGKMCTNTLQ